MAIRGDLAEYERQFRRSGLPLFIEDYSASEDIFTRAAPLLALVFVGEMFGATELEWPLLLNAAAALGGLMILVVAFGLFNRARHRPFLSLPRQVGRPELAAFVVIPALLPVIFGFQWHQSLALLAGNGALLVLIFSLVLFVNAEMWQMFASMPQAFVWVVIALVLGLGLMFLVMRAPGLVRELEHDLNTSEQPLSRRQRVNVGLTLVVSQALQVLVVSSGVGAFFVVFGVLAVTPEVGESWAGTDGAWHHPFELLGHDVQITETLLRVAGGMAAFTGLYYAISIWTDATYRDEFLEAVTVEMRGVFEARARYLALRTIPAGDTGPEVDRRP
ncbi:hypothetical protein CLV30_11940 [Haloactinopolyspora alba]|uniref:Integral membrane protein n=1 Tax=Haloactinopolyspora alba TaxID=648780 RepID=A0A2P8DN54_9ACTN|nr:hypothetical protein [Haloactinopolyspora alba]PSK98658.1 hypothetical protein CLV30_11940 [Haloactinopolyspora alba]